MEKDLEGLRMTNLKDLGSIFQDSKITIWPCQVVGWDYLTGWDSGFSDRVQVQLADILLAGVWYHGIQLHGLANVSRQLGNLPVSTACSLVKIRRE